MDDRDQRRTGYATAVVEVSGLHWATEKAVVEAVLGRRPGVASVEVNPVAQTATVTFDPAETSISDLRQWVQECGYHCAGQAVPNHVCDPMAEPGATHPAAEAPSEPEQLPSPQDAMGHGGHGGMSMASMVADMRNRFVVAAVFSLPILLWSPIGREVIGFTAQAPFGLGDDVWQLLLSLPVVFWAASIFFDGALRALRARTLDMMVLVAVAVGAGWLYSLGVTLTGGGEVFFQGGRGRGGGGGPERGRRVHGHRREPSRAQGAGGGGHRRHHQQERHPAGAGHQGRCRHRPGPDRQARTGGAELQGPGPAPSRPGRLLAGLRRPPGGRAHLRGVDAAERPAWPPAPRSSRQRRSRACPGTGPSPPWADAGWRRATFASWTGRASTSGRSPTSASA